MKAPDKIYMPNELLSEEWQRHIEGEDTEYVRKDSLWKPTSEQLEALHTAAYLDEMEFYGGLKDKLRELYEHLIS